MALRFSRSIRQVASCLVLGMLAACDSAAPPAAGPQAGATIEPRSARFAKFEEVTEWSGQAFGSVAEFNLLDATGATIDRSKWTAIADSSGTSDAATNAIDGNPQTHWHSKWDGVSVPPPPHWLVVGLGLPARVSGFRYLPRQDKTGNGTFAQYRLYLSDDGVNWGDPVTTGDFKSSGGDMGAEKTVIFARQSENHLPEVKAPPAQTASMGQTVSLRVEASDADGDQLAYAADGLPSGLVISPTTGTVSGTPIVPGSYKSSVRVTDRKGDPVSVAIAWSILPAAQAAGAVALKPGEVRFVKLEEVSEVHDKAWASIAEFNVIDSTGANLPRTGWVASADSAGVSDLPVSAIDGNPSTQWHTQWDGASPPPPHSFIVDMGHGERVAGFRYLPRQDNSTNGTIARFRFYTSVDGIEWGKPVAEGDLSAIGESRSEKTVHVK